MKQKILIAAFLVLSTFTFTFGQNYYLGVGDSTSVQGTSCASCHYQGGIASPKFEEWKHTLHAEAQDSINNSHYGFACLRCHNTGWDTDNMNYGADEYVVQDTTVPNYRITDLANFNRVKNVQCEACHGPLGTADSTLSYDHWDFKGVNKLDYSAELCGKCHQGSHHGFYEEWAISGHAHSADSSLAFVVNNPACVKCHVAQSFVRYAEDPENYQEKLDVTGDEIQPLTCVACHDPHSKEFPHQLRFPVSGTRVICDECHNAEIEDTVDINSTPHHTTSGCLSGSKLFGYQYPDKKYQSSAHTFAAKERCINCHLNAEGPGPFGGVAHGHTFLPKVQACIGCHADYTTVVDTSNHEKMFDYRGTQTKTDSLIAVLQETLNNVSAADSATDKFKEANYNLAACQQEGSHGIHNTRLVQKLLEDAIASMIPTSVTNDKSVVPTQYSLSQNYPNPFNPTTQIDFAIPKAGNVQIIIYDAIGNEVATLVNKYMPQGKYTVDWNASTLASGIYLYRIQTNDFSMVKKMVLLK